MSTITPVMPMQTSRLNSFGHYQIEALFGLRGLAALVVMVAHVFEIQPKVFSFQNQAVDVFFALSGFTLGITYGIGFVRSLAFREYIVARVARVYPLYFFVLCISAVYTIFGQSNFYSNGEYIRELFRQALLINAWPVIGTGAHWAPPMWSLSIEAFCYIAIFPVAFIGGRIVPKMPAWTLIAIAVILPAISIHIFTMYYDPVINGPQRIPLPAGPVYWVNIVRGICMFSSGLALAALKLHNPFVSYLFSRATAAISVVFCLFALLPYISPVDSAWIVLPATMLILSISEGRGRLAGALSVGAMQLLGKYSYSIYLIHWPVMVVCSFLQKKLLGHGILISDILKDFIVIFIVVGAASPIYRYLEDPMRRAIRAWGTSRSDGCIENGPAQA